MKRFTILGLPVLCLLILGSGLCFRYSNRDAELENAFEAVLRYRLLRTRWIENYPPIYLTLNGKDPSPEFLKRFENSKIPVKKGSEAGEKGFWYTLKAEDWNLNHQIEIDAYYNCGLECGGTSRFHLIRKAGKWVVKEEEEISVE